MAMFRLQTALSFYFPMHNPESVHFVSELQRKCWEDAAFGISWTTIGVYYSLFLLRADNGLSWL